MTLQRDLKNFPKVYVKVDLLSPALFLLVSEFLGQGLQHLFMQKQDRLYVTATSKVPYLAFADDILIFARCSKDCLDALAGFFTQYQEYSGQRINAHESSFLILKRATDSQVAMVVSKLHFQQQFFPFTYLGMSIARGRVMCILFDSILAKMRDRLFHQSAKLL